MNLYFSITSPTNEDLGATPFIERDGQVLPCDGSYELFNHAGDEDGIRIEGEIISALNMKQQSGVIDSYSWKVVTEADL